MYINYGKMGYIAKMPKNSAYKTDKPKFKEGNKVVVIKAQNDYEVGYKGIVTNFYIDAFSHCYTLDNLPNSIDYRCLDNAT
ncbi:hypothetical protein [Joostella sp. CR20]|uniref:hypothetical protein n=1 Tax=Joostella sp. CR20 TaxID=2804312 RepID=UPI00313E5FEE